MLRKILAVTVVAVTLSTVSIASADNAAIAFSQSTGKFGYSFGYCCRAHAEAAALSRCQVSDAKIVVWGENAWCALAVGSGNAYGWGWASSQADAERMALENCSKHAKDCRIVVRVFSGT
jgi:hypothetical protein